MSGFFNLGLELGDAHKLSFNSMYLRQTQDRVRRMEGIDENQILKRFRLQWVENELFSNQVAGEHTLPFWDLGFDWQFTKATASHYAPNTKRYRRDDDNNDGEYLFSTRTDSNSQVFANLEDNLTDWSAAASLPVELGSVGKLTLNAGISGLERDRDASIRTFSFDGRIFGDPLRLPQSEILSPEFIGPDGLLLEETTLPTDNYTAIQELDARFFKTDFKLFQDWRLVLGFRVEDNFQKVTTANLANPDAPPVIGKIDQMVWLPSGSLTWSYSDNAQIRLGYAESVSRPDFRELSQAPYRDPILDLITVGNPALETTRLKHYDARWEYYFSPTDSFSVAAFYKDLNKPIEKTFSAGGSSQFINLQNALAAEVYGFELALHHSLGFLGGVDWLDELSLGPLGPLSWKNYYIAANYTWLESSVQIDTSLTTQTNSNRPLQGASPYVVNLQLGYTSPDGSDAWTLLFNEFGERIARAGVAGQPDIYQQPLPLLSFVYQHRFGEHWGLNVRLRNLLNPEIKYTQGHKVTREYHKGREISIGVRWNF